MVVCKDGFQNALHTKKHLLLSWGVVEALKCLQRSVGISVVTRHAMLAKATRLLIADNLLKRHVVVTPLFLFTVQVAWAQNAELLNISFEELLQTQVTTAQTLTQQYNNGFSAVSVMTAEDIRQYGYRSLKEILNGMRGLHTLDYFGNDLLNSRGYSSVFSSGSDFKLDSRLMLLVDGENVGDNQVGQVLLGENQLVDVNLIEQVEYVPGAGSVRYSDTAFLGTINIITKKGQAWAGTMAAVGFGRSGEQYQRLQYSGALPNEGEMLAAYSQLNTSTQPIYMPDQFAASGQPGRDKQIFLKMRWPALQVTLAHAQSDHLSRNITTGDRVEQADLNIGLEHTYLGLDYSVSLSSQLKSSTHLFFGHKKYQYLYAALSNDFLVPDQVVSISENRQGEAMWWGLGQELVFQLNAHHTLLAGLSLRNDFKNAYTNAFSFSDLAPEHSEGNEARRRASAYLHDDWQWSPSVKLGMGARFDHNHLGNSTWSPRANLQWQATDQTSLKLSQAITYRDPTPYELTNNPQFLLRQEQMHLTELVIQHQLSAQAQLVASMYRYEIDDYIDTQVQRIEVLGQELEYTQQWNNGVRTRMSLTHQDSKDNLNSPRLYSPHVLGKLNLAIPFSLDGKRFFLGWDSRYVSRYQDDLSESFGNAVISNITLNLPRMFNQVDSFVTVRNVFNGQNATGIFSRENERNVWLQMEYQFK